MQMVASFERGWGVLCFSWEVRSTGPGPQTNLKVRPLRAALLRNDGLVRTTFKPATGSTRIPRFYSSEPDGCGGAGAMCRRNLLSHARPAENVGLLKITDFIVM
jgi:hypothetical protein